MERNRRRNVRVFALSRAACLAAAVLLAGVPAGAAGTRPAAAAGSALQAGRQVGGRTAAVALHDGRVLLAAGPRLLVVDVDEPDRPVEVGAGDPSFGTIAAIDVRGDLAATATDWGVVVADVSATAGPQYVAAYGIGAVDVALADEALFFLDQGLRLHACPAPIAAYSPDGPRSGFRQRCTGTLDTTVVRIARQPGGVHVYGADPAGRVLVVDVSDVSLPMAAGEWAAPGPVIDLAVSGTTLLAACEGAGADGGGVAAYDLTDPAAPVALGTLALDLPAPASLAIDGDRLIVATEAAGIYVVDASDPTALALLGRMALPALGIAVGGDTAYAARAGMPGLAVIDVSTPTAPTHVGDLDTPGRIADVDGDAAQSYLADPARGVFVLDGGLAEPALAVVETGGSTRVSAAGDRLYAMGLVGGSALTGVHLIDVAGPKPAIVDRIDLPGLVGPDWDIDASVAGLAFVADGTGVTVVDATEPGAMAAGGKVVLSGPATQVEAEGSWAAVVTAPAGPWPGGVAVVDASDPAGPRNVATISARKIQGRMESASVAIEADRLYLAEWIPEIAGSVALRVFDMADPSDPKELGSVQSTYAGEAAPRLALGAEAGYATLAVWSAPNVGEVRLVDALDPGAPVEIGFVPAPRWIVYPEDVRLAAADGRSLLGCGWSGATQLWRTYARPSRTADPGGDTPLDLALAGQTGGVGLAVAANQGRVFVAEGPRVAAYDLSDPARPHRTARSDVLPGIVQDLAVDGDRLLAATYGGLQILDAAAPDELPVIGSLDMGTDEAARIAVAGDTAFVAGTLGGGLLVVDVSDPSAPQVRSTIMAFAGGAGFATDGRYLYAAPFGNAIEVYDVADPVAPVRVGERVATRRAVADMVVANGRLVVALETELSPDDSESPGGMAVYDLSTPESPVAIGDLELDLWEVTLAVEGDTALVGSTWLDPGGPALLATVDLTDPTAPRLSGTVECAAADVALSGGVAVASIQASGRALVLDLRDPGAPSVAATMDRTGAAMDMAIAGEHAYVADRGFGLRIHGVDPASWTGESGAIALPVARAVDAFEDLAVVVGTVIGEGAGQALSATLAVVDVSDPAAPSLRGVVESAGEYFEDVALLGDHALVVGQTYMTGSAAVLRVYDLTDPSAPNEVAALDLSETGADLTLTVEGTRAYVTAALGPDWPGGVLIVELSEPGSPREVGRVAGVNASSIAVDGHLLYVTEWLTESGIEYATSLIVYDVVDPTRPTRLGSYTWRREHQHPEAGTAMGESYQSSVSVCDGIAYVAGRAMDLPGPFYLQVVDTRDPSQLWPVGAVELPTWFGGLATFEWRTVATEMAVYVAQVHNGLLAVEPFIPEPEGDPLHLAGQSGGAGYAVAADGLLLLKGEGPRVVAYDLADPTRPREIGRTRVLSGVVRDLAVDGDRAYAAAFGSLEVLDVSDPTAPTPVATLALGAHEALQLALADGRAYVLLAASGAQDGSVVVIDVSTAAPRVLARIDEADCTTIAAHAGHLYCGNAGRLATFDVSDARRMTRVDDLSLEALFPGRLRVSGGMLYAFGGHQVTEAVPIPIGWPAALAVLDLTTPSHPIPIGRLDLGTFEGGDLVVGPTAAYAIGPSALQAIDISDPMAPLPTTGVAAGGDAAALAGSRLYASAGSGGLLVVDVGNPTAPTAPTGVDTAGRTPDVAAGEAVSASVDEAFGLRVHAIDAAGEPVLLGRLALPGARDVVVQGGYAHASARLTGSDSVQLASVDLSDPTAPVVTAILDGPALDLLGADADQLYAVEIGATSKVTVLRPLGTGIVMAAGSVSLPGNALDVAAGDGLAVVLSVQRVLEPPTYGFTVIDAADPMRPRAAGSGALTGFLPQRAALEGGLLVIAGHADPAADGPATRLVAFDLADPDHPRPVGTADWHADPATGGRDVLALAVQGGVAHILTSPRIGGPGREIRLVDLSGAEPVLLGALDVPSSGRRRERAEIAVAADGVLVADGDGGLLVLRAPRPVPGGGRLWLPVAARRGPIVPPPQRTCAQLPLHVTFAVDTSAAMAASLGAGAESRIDVARAALGAALAGLDLGANSAALVHFDAQAGRVATGNRLPFLQAAVDRLAIGRGPRRIDLGLEAAARDLSEARSAGAERLALVVLYTGSSGADAAEAGRVLSALAAQGVSAFSVALGADADPEILLPAGGDPRTVVHATEPGVAVAAVAEAAARLADCGP